MEVHHTVQFDVTDTALEHAMLGSQLFATDVIAYAFQVYKPVNQNEGKENGKEGGDRCKSSSSMKNCAVCGRSEISLYIGCCMALICVYLVVGVLLPCRLHTLWYRVVLPMG